MLISAEFELPVVNPATGLPAQQSQFVQLWNDLSQSGWEKNGYGVKRMNVALDQDCVIPGQFITTDTGPTIEFSPTPSLTVGDIDSQAQQMREEIIGHLSTQGLALLGSGVHPFLGTTFDEYYQFRSPRKAYDYAIKEREWRHWSILNIAATQEVIDVSSENAIRVLRCCHRLAGPLIFLFRNDPDYHGHAEHRLSVRPDGWRRHPPLSGKYAVDRVKFLMPDEEICSWKDYFRLLWRSTPMFFLGTKNDGPVFVPEHPTFWDFLFEAPKEGWHARRIADNTEFQLLPDTSHAEGTDWSYMGFARLRFKFKPSLFEGSEFKRKWNACDTEVFDELMQTLISSLMIENRSIAAAPRGEEVASLALMVGLLQNLDETESFLMKRPYYFWLQCARSAEFAPLASSVHGVSVCDLLTSLLEIADDGLRKRNFGEEVYLAPLRNRLHRRSSPAEEAMAIFGSHGMQGVLRRSCYR